MISEWLSGVSAGTYSLGHSALVMEEQNRIKSYAGLYDTRIFHVFFFLVYLFPPKWYFLPRIFDIFLPGIFQFTCDIPCIHVFPPKTQTQDSLLEETFLPAFF